MIDKKTMDLLQKLSNEDFFVTNKAVLIGGTAISYHLNHRMSYDIDVCILGVSKLPELDFLAKYNIDRIGFDKFTTQSVINQGGDIYDYHQRFKIDNIKVDISVNPAHNILEDEILENDIGVTMNNIKIASIDALFKIKSLLLIDRNKIRDLYDVCYMLEHTKHEPQDIFNAIKNYRITYTEKDILNLIKAKEVDIEDVLGEGIYVLNQTISTDYNVLKDNIVDKLENILISCFKANTLKTTKKKMR